MIAVAVLAAALTLWTIFWLEALSVLSCIVCAVYIVLLLVVPWWPKIASVVLLMSDPVLYFLFTDVTEISYFGNLVAIAILAYEITNRSVALMLVVCSCVQLLENLLPNTYGLNIQTYPSFVIMDILAALIGCSLRWHKQYFEMRRRMEHNEAQLERIRTNERIARNIHDSVTGDLSFIVRKAHQYPESDDWDQVGEAALKALSSVHQIIDKLDEKADALSADSDFETFVGNLTDALHSHDRRLQQIGFQGVSNVHVSRHPAALDGAKRTVIGDCLTEVFANIMRHSTPEGSYQVSVELGREGAVIMAVNDCPAADAATSFPGGTGLERWRHMVCDEYHGAMDAGVVDGQWQLRVFIPGNATDIKKNGRSR
ncbi:signal transduction histidine kinase-like protein [Bifidobacterium sp. DSM 109957]|uniref:Signal transduction histidine kinase-like protein n=2 Tax=Bifidobacterium oedipodis TaxID=2675322 RepID=A0A7Y0EQ15_9BIFI|nr:signal transduction histidine kinase-like protein [Bifidobacterium sp. DSM 109957]